MDPVLQVVCWWIAFGGTHTLLSHPPVRSALVQRLGEQGFRGLYSLVAFATFIPLVTTFFLYRAGRGIWLPGLIAAPGLWWITVLVNLLAVVLIVLGFSSRNPVSTLTGQPGSQARGILRVTRHPGFMGFALLGLGHLLVLRAPMDVAFFGGLVLYSLLGAAHQDWRRRKSAPELASFYRETSFFPFVAVWQGRTRFVPEEIGRGAVVVSLVAFALLFVVHHRLFG